MNRADGDTTRESISLQNHQHTATNDGIEKRGPANTKSRAGMASAGWRPAQRIGQQPSRARCASRSHDWQRVAREVDHDAFPSVSAFPRNQQCPSHGHAYKTPPRAIGHSPSATNRPGRSPKVRMDTPSCTGGTRGAGREHCVGSASELLDALTAPSAARGGGRGRRTRRGPCARWRPGARRARGAPPRSSRSRRAPCGSR